MADLRKNVDLSADVVETDGEPIVQRKHFFDQHPSSKSLEKDRFESGCFSMSPNPSLESKSLKQEDKAPVQCSDGDSLDNVKFRKDTKELEKQFAALQVDDDEGILSYESIKSLESIQSENGEDVEVDLYARDLDGDTLIHLAILSGTINLALALIDLADDKECLNLQNDLFQTQLHLAIITENYEIALELIKKGANVKLCDKQGNTPLHLACKKDDKEVIKAILDTFGNDENSRKKYFTMKNCQGLTALHIASECKHFITMGFLFAKGADVNIGDAKSGRTILHFAAEKRDLETVVLLLTHPSIDVDSKTFKGETPLVLAFWRNYHDIVKKLKSNGACFNYDMFEESDDDTS